MPYTKKKAYSLNYEFILRLENEKLKALCFLPELSGRKQRALRACLKEQGIVLHYIKLNIVKKLLKNKKVLGLNNKVAILLIKEHSNPKKLYHFLIKNDIILNFLFIKNLIIDPMFLLEKKKHLVNLNNLVIRKVLFIKKLLFKIITINNTRYANK